MVRDARQVVFDAYDVTVAVEIRHAHDRSSCPSPDLERRLIDYLPPGAHRRSNERDAVEPIVLACLDDRFTVTVSPGDERVFATPDLALHQVDQFIRSRVAVAAPGLVFVHAGVVVLGGEAIVLPGRSMAGKTTLVTELVRAGAAYSSDEYAVFDSDGLVHPYPRRLSIRDANGRREVPVSEIGGQVADGPVPVGLVAVLHFRPGSDWSISEVGQARCAEALLANAVAAQIRPNEVLRCAALVARSTRCVEGHRGESADAVTRLWDLVRS